MNHRCPDGEAPENDAAKSAMHDLLAASGVHGVVAVADESIVGWCAIDPIATQTGHDYYIANNGDVDATAWAIHCVYVHPAQRGRGVSSGLVDGAVAYARERGASCVLSFPIPPDNRERFAAHDDEFSGRYATYDRLGFERIDALGDFYAVMRLAL